MTQEPGHAGVADKNEEKHHQELYGSESGKNSVRLEYTQT